MLDAEGLLRVNRGTDANRLNALLTFITTAILDSGKQIFESENEDQLRSQSMLSKLQSGECRNFWK